MTLTKLVNSCPNIVVYDMDNFTTSLNPNEITRIVGIYFLCIKNEIVYVGESVHVLNRLRMHKLKFVFDKAAVLPMKISEKSRNSNLDNDYKKLLFQVETHTIWKLRPILNYALTTMENCTHEAKIDINDVVKYGCRKECMVKCLMPTSNRWLDYVKTGKLHSNYKHIQKIYGKKPINDFDCDDLFELYNTISINILD